MASAPATALGAVLAAAAAAWLPTPFSHAWPSAPTLTPTLPHHPDSHTTLPPTHPLAHPPTHPLPGMSMPADAARIIIYASYMLWGIGVPLCFVIMVIYFRVTVSCCACFACWPWLACGASATGCCAWHPRPMCMPHSSPHRLLPFLPRRLAFPPMQRLLLHSLPPHELIVSSFMPVGPIGEAAAARLPA